MKDIVKFCKYNINTYRHIKCYLHKYNHLFKFGMDEDVLEIGCATGKITKEVLIPLIEDYVPRLKAVDICKKALDVATKCNAHPKVRYAYLDITNDAECKKYANKYQHIFSFNCFHMIKETQTWANNVYKMLTPTGQCFSSIILNPQVMLQPIANQRMDKTTPWAKRLELYKNGIVEYGPESDKLIGNILRNTGFAIDTLEVLHMCHTFPDIDRLNRTLLSLNSFTNELPVELQIDYEADFLSKARECIEFAEDGTCCFYTDVLILLVTKSPLNNN